MKKVILSLSFLVLLTVSGCDAPSPFTWKGDYHRNNDIFDLVGGVVSILTVKADPATINSVDDRIIITATVENAIGRPMSGVYVTFTTDTGFFRSEEFGPSDIFTTVSDNEGKAYAHLLKVGRTCTVKVEAGGIIVHVVIAFS